LVLAVGLYFGVRHFDGIAASPVETQLNHLKSLLDKIALPGSRVIFSHRVDDCSAASGAPYVDRRYLRDAPFDSSVAGYQDELASRGWELAPVDERFVGLSMRKRIAGRFAFVSVQGNDSRLYVSANISCARAKQ
jgi:hypothetical protein